MPVSFIAIVITLTVVGASLCILVINLWLSKKSFRGFDFRNISMQLLAITIWVSILSNTFFPNHSLTENSKAGITVFAIAVVIGILMIRSMFREVEIENTVEELVRRLHKNNLDLKKLDIQKSEFISLASHQLRGPLSNIYGYISMLLEGDYGDVPAHLKEPMTRIYQSTSFLGFLVNDFLNVSRIDKGEMEYTIEDFDISDFLAKTVSEFSVSAQAAKLDLIREFSDDKEIMIRADKNKIKQIISNLLDNAIKYTPKGFVSVNLAQTDSEAIITIKDSGIGLTQKIKNQLFKKFVRDVNASKVNVTGSGLGLYVASMMAKGMDSKIWAESAGENQGTTFYVEIPLAKK